MRLKAASLAVFALVAAPGCGDPSQEGLARTSGAVTFGAETPAHPEVVALMQKGVPRCTGTLIAPHVVLTAAHCMDLVYDHLAFGADPSAPDAKRVITTYRRHPAFDRTTLANDYALLLMRQPVDYVPAALADGTEALAVGGVARVVGFGQTEVADARFYARDGDAKIAAVEPSRLRLTPGPSQPCHGDSGGPVFVESKGELVLTGVVSEGDARCLEYANVSRVDAQRAWIDAFVAATKDGAAAVGDRCLYPENCAAGAVCYAPPDAPNFGYCSKACATSTECPSAMECRDGACRHPVSPGSLGVACALETDCATGKCWRESKSAPLVCSDVCLPQYSNACPAGFECKLDPDRFNNWGCFRGAPEPAAAPPAQEPGCSTSRSAPGGAPGLLPASLALCTLGALGLARRRPAPPRASLRR